ncbi:MAG: HAD family phosphatase [Ruminococcus sp.]|nr:HAD family phosphatase [Ruminococcus sp.]
MPDIKSYKGHIFDLDGTLIKSNHVWNDVDTQFLGKRGIEVPEDYSKALSVMNFDQAAAYTKERFSLPDDTDSIKDEWFDMALYQYSHVIGLYEGVYDYLAELHKNGRLLALATASSPLLYTPVLERTGIYGFFSAFVTTEKVKRGKGFPDVYLKAAEELGLKPKNCVVYEDIIEGIRAAGSAGFHTAACINGRYPDDEEMKECSEYIFRDEAGTTD